MSAISKIRTSDCVALALAAMSCALAPMASAQIAEPVDNAVAAESKAVETLAPTHVEAVSVATAQQPVAQATAGPDELDAERQAETSRVARVAPAATSIPTTSHVTPEPVAVATAPSGPVVTPEVVEAAPSVRAEPAAVPEVVVAATSVPTEPALTPEVVAAAPTVRSEVPVAPEVVAAAPSARTEPAVTPEVVVAASVPAEPVVAPEVVAAAAKPEPVSPPPVAPGAALSEERYLIQALAPLVPVYDKPNDSEPPIARLELGTQVEADAKQGDWYRIRLGGGGSGWILNAPFETGMTLAVAPLRDKRAIDFQAGRADPRVPQSITPDKPGAVAVAPAAESEIDRRRPAGERIEPRLPIIDPAQVPAPSPYALREEVPVRDRWRIVKSLGLLPYNVRDPYNPNVLKGDLPVLEKELGPDWFFNLSAVSDTLFEFRRLPTPAGAQSTARPGSNNTLGRGKQSAIVETGILSFSLIKGDTTFRPPDYEFRFVPVISLNRVMTEEVRAVKINPAFGENRNDSYIGVQELFVDKHLRDVSTRYDFDSVRVGIQPFTADFRGFLFLDQPLGVRIFGTRDNNLWQYNLGYFRRLEKDTNSGLNDIKTTPRADDIFVANLYRQDFPVLGFTSQAVILHNRNREGNRGAFFNANGFRERPAILGTSRPHNYDVTYFGLNGDGHFGRWNLTGSAYYATGDDSRGMLSGRPENINAQFGAFELSRDFDFLRVRLSGIWATGDKNPFDGKAGGFDAVLENPLIAGADTSYWIRQSIPLIGGGGTALSIRNGVLASLRTSREHGQSNFTNPGLHLLGIGADYDLSPQVRLISNLNYLEFDNLSSLATLRNQRLTSTKIGYDLSFGIQYRPLFTQNIVVNASAAALRPEKGLKELYGNAVDSTQYSALINMLFTF